MQVARPFHLLTSISLSIVVSFGVVAVWRGFWYIQDIYFYPDNFEYSLWLSMCTGCIGLVLAEFFRFFFAPLLHKLSTPVRIGLIRLFALYLIWCSASVWRGCWYFWDEYTLVTPDDDTTANICCSLEDSSWLSIIVGILILVVTCSCYAAIAPPFTFFYDSAIFQFGLYSVHDAYQSLSMDNDMSSDSSSNSDHENYVIREQV